MRTVVQSTMDGMNSPWTRAAIGANTFDPAQQTVLPTIYERTTATAAEFSAVNLGQGFPDQQGPQWLLEAAATAIADHGVGPSNQYAPGVGLPALREAIANDMWTRQGLSLYPDTQVMATTGATEGIAAAILAFAEPGSQVVTFEPHYDSYGACVALAGAELVGVPLRTPGFRPDIEALSEAVNERTSLILINTPHNPTGTVFTEEELTAVVNIAQRYGAMVMSDEVYERLVLHGTDSEHRSVLTVDGAEDVAVAVSSAGKTFSVTGWKVGWVMGSAKLINQVRGVKQFLSYSSGPAFQYAVAQGLEDDRGFLEQNRTQLSHARDTLFDGLEPLGLQPHRAEAGYFVLADISGVTGADDVAFCRALAEYAQVAAIPVSSLIIQHRAAEDSALRRLVRFAFCKHPSTLNEALERLETGLPKALATL